MAKLQEMLDLEGVIKQLDTDKANLLRAELKKSEEQLAGFVEKPSFVKGWEGLFDTPVFIRGNTTILGKADELLNAGFKHADLNFLSKTINKLKLRELPNDGLIKVTEHLLEARKHTDQWRIYGLETDLFKQVDKLASSNKFKNPKDLEVFLGEVHLNQNIKENPGHLEQLNIALYDQ